jgi:hypothetical protein
MENENKTTPKLKFSLSWSEKNANEISNFFGSIVGLMLGCVFFLLLIYYFKFFKQEIIDIGNLAFVIGGLIFVGSLSFILMSIFESKSQKAEQKLKEYEEQSNDYILSDSSIKTLEFVVPNDITGCLETILKEAKNSPGKLIEMKRSDGWLEQLKKKLGPARMTEFENTILKYTRRENPQLEENLKTA